MPSHSGGSGPYRLEVVQGAVHGHRSRHDFESREAAFAELERIAAAAGTRAGRLGYQSSRVIDTRTGETLVRHTAGVPGSARRQRAAQRACPLDAAMQRGLFGG